MFRECQTHLNILVPLFNFKKIVWKTSNICLILNLLYLSKSYKFNFFQNLHHKFKIDVFHLFKLDIYIGYISILLGLAISQFIYPDKKCIQAYIFIYRVTILKADFICEILECRFLEKFIYLIYFANIKNYKLFIVYIWMANLNL